MKYCFKSLSFLACMCVSSCSKNLATLTSSTKPFLLLVLIINSLERWLTSLGSSTFSWIDLSNGSPGASAHLLN